MNKYNDNFPWFELDGPPKPLELVTPQEHFQPGNLLRKCLGFKNHTWIYQTILILKVEHFINEYKQNQTWLTFVREDGAVIREAWHEQMLARSAWIHYDITREEPDDDDFFLTSKSNLLR